MLVELAKAVGPMPCKMLTSNNWVILEIASTRSSLDLLKAKQAYQARFKKSLEEDVAYHTKGDIRKVINP